MAGVVLLHGISRTARSMRPLERRLARAGYATANLDYPSRRLDLAALAEHLAPQVDAFATTVDGPVHFVTHSMGGLVARVLLTQRRPACLGRVVMLAPPNGGSEVADHVSKLALYRQWFGPAGMQLVTHRDPATAGLFGPVDYELGVIAGNHSLYPFASALLPRPNDGRVALARTAVEGMTDHLVVPATHPLIMRIPAVGEQVVAFLRNGHFVRL